jgi:hypothetical protein
MSHAKSAMGRRGFLRLASAAAASGALAAGAWPRGARGDQAGESGVHDRKLLFIFCAYGGASIIDSFMPVLDQQVGDASLAATLNVFPEALLEQQAGSAFRTVKLLDNYAYYAKPARGLRELVGNHGRDIAIVAHDVTSVSHAAGQQRALNGAGVDRGRTIMESCALRHGPGLPLPSCNMATEGYGRHGSDSSVPRAARHETIMAPSLFAAGTHGFRGLSGGPEASAVERGRRVRAELDASSVFARTFKQDTRLQSYLRTRQETAPLLEQAGLVDKLLLLPADKLDARYGLTPDPLVASLRSTLPAMDEDKLEAQIALGFLMAYHGVSCSVSMGLNTEPFVRKDGGIVGAPVSFDFSHNMHRVVQSLMWARTATLVDALIGLLKTHDYLGDPALGKMWDRSLVYIASEFGRDKKRPAGSSDWGTGHDLNNGSVLISPLLRGNAVYGGVDPRTGMTYGFDPLSGAPEQGRTLYEGDVYGIISQALGLPVPGGRRYDGVVRG